MRGEEAGKERYLSFRLLTSFLLRSSTPTKGSSSGSLSTSQLPSALTDTKPSPSNTRRMRSGFEPKKETLGEFKGRISPPGRLSFTWPSLSVTPTISPSSISECSESALSLCSPDLEELQSTLLLRGSWVAREGVGKSVKMSVESGGTSSFSSSFGLSVFLFISLDLAPSSLMSDAGEPVGSKGSYLSPSSSSSIFPSLSPSVG